MSPRYEVCDTKQAPGGVYRVWDAKEQRYLLTDALATLEGVRAMVERLNTVGDSL